MKMIGEIMQIFLVRHGEVLSNKLKHYNYENEELNETGIEQAKVLGEKIKDLNFDVIFSSPLIRAKQTAEIINNNNLNIIYDERLRERKVGDLAGKPLSFTKREEYWNYNTSCFYGTEESIKDFFKRIFNFLDELKTLDFDKVLIVSHSGVSKAFSAYFEGLKDGMFLNRGLPNGEIIKYIL